jgi:hypothetical protein
MKVITFIFILSTGLLLGCSPFTINTLNRALKEEPHPLKEWDKDLFKARSKVFEQLSINLDHIDNLYLIEEYNVQGLYYSCAVCVDGTRYFHFVRNNLLVEPERINKELTLTESFIFNKIKENKLNEIEEKSNKTDVMSPSALYITIAKRELVKKTVKVLILKEFYIDPPLGADL